jgi:hypothetical protein
MDNNTKTIQFLVPNNDDKIELNLVEGEYTASVKKLAADGDQIQYQVSEFKHSGKDSKIIGENQLIFIRNNNEEGSRWLEAFHNSQNELTQQIGREIEKVFNDRT